MKSKYDYIHFIDTGDDKFACCANRDEIMLGYIEYFSRWKQYVYVPKNSLYSHDCLTDIADFLKQLNERKKSSGK